MDDANSALQSASLAQLPPLVAIERGTKFSTAAELKTGLRAKFDVLEQHWFEALRESNTVEDEDAVPTLYGIIISHTLVAVLAWHPVLHAKTGMPTLGYFDFGDRDYDVWNALAVAILCVHVRNVAKGMVESGVVEVDVEDEEDEDEVMELDDPDA